MERQTQLAGLKWLSIASIWLGVLLFCVVIFLKMLEVRFPLLPFGVASVFLVSLSVLNAIFLFFPKGETHAIGRGAFQLFLCAPLILFFPFWEETGSDRIFGNSEILFGIGLFILLYSGNYALLKYRSLSDQLREKTFRNEANRRLQYWRRWQLVGLSLALGGFLSIIVIPILVVISACGIAILLGIYCHVKRQLKCPKCGASLGYLVIDPSDARTPSAIILPWQLPEKVTHCPFCGMSFDEPTYASAPRASL